MSEPAAADAVIVADLVRLARKGAYAVPVADATGRAFAVYSPRNDFARPIAQLPEAGIGHALARGWLSADAGTGRVQLSDAGRRVVRRALSEAARPAHASRQPPAKISAGPARQARPAPSIAQRVEGPLAWLRRRKDRAGRPLITQVQFDAGERLAADFARARMLPRITASWSPAAPCQRAQWPAGGGVEISDGALAARDRLHRALAAVGQEIATLLVDVCCHEVGLEAAERARGWPQRSGKVVLDMGLTALARHYGLIAPEPAGRSPRPRSWMEDGYAASLDAWR